MALPFATVTPRWMRISYVVFGLVWLASGALSLTKGDTAGGGFDLALGVACLLIAAFKSMRPATDQVDRD